MNIAYWIIAGLQALFYLYSGGVKLVQSKERLRPMMGWVDATPLGVIRTIGALEVLAAIGLTALQVGAIILHLSRGEARLIAMNVVLLATAATTVWLATIWL